MPDNISELYKVAKSKGVLAKGLTEDMFRKQTASEEGLRSFYNYASSHGMKLRPWPEFSAKARGNGQQNYTATTPTPSPKSSTPQAKTDSKGYVVPPPGYNFGFASPFTPNKNQQVQTQVQTPPATPISAKPNRVELPGSVLQRVEEMTPRGAAKRETKHPAQGFRTVAEYDPSKSPSASLYGNAQSKEELLQQITDRWLDTYDGMNSKAKLDSEIETLSKEVQQEIQDNFMSYPIVQWQMQAYKEGKLTREQLEEALKSAGDKLYKSELKKRAQPLYDKFQEDFYRANEDIITSELYRLGEIDSPIKKKKDPYWKDFLESMAAGTWHIARFPEQAVGAFEDWGSGALEYIFNQLTFNGFGGRLPQLQFASKNNGIGRRFIHNYLGGDFAEWREKYYRNEAARFDDDIDFFTEIKNGKWNNAIEKLGLSTAENTPNLVLSVAAAAAGYPEPAAGLLAGQASCDKWEEIANDNSLSPEDKAVSVLGTFLSEYFFERLGDMRYQKMFGKVPNKEIQKELRKSGIKAWDKFAKVGNILGTGWNTAMEYAGESITEMATELSEQCIEVYLGKQDHIDWNAVGYAGVVAMASDAPLQMTHGVMNTHHRSELQKDIESNPELVQFANEKGMNVEQIVDLLVKKEKGGSFDQKESEIYQEFIDKSKEVAAKAKEKRDIYLKAVEELAKEEGLEVEDVLHQIEVEEKALSEDRGMSGMDMPNYRNLLFDKLKEAGFFDNEPQDRQTQLRQQATQAAQQEVQGMAHQDGYVYYVGIKGKEDAEGYAVSGNLNVQQDQQGMYGTRGRDLVTVKMNDGSVQQVPADELVVRDIPVSADELMQERTEHYFAQYANEDLFHVGDKVYIKQNGQPSEDSSTIVNITDEGVEVEIIDPNGQPNTTIIPHEQAAEMLSKAEGTEDGVVTFQMRDGNTIRLRDMGDGTFASIVSEGEQPYKFTAEELESMGAKRVENPAQGQPIINNGQPVQGAPVQGQAPVQPVQGQAPAAPVQPVQPAQPQFGSNAPGIDELSAEDFAAQTVEFMQSPKVAQGYLTAERAKVNAQLQQLEKEGVTEYNSAEEYRTKAQQLEQSKARLQAQLEKIDGAIAAINAQAEAAVARKNINEAIRKRAAEFSKQLGANIVIFDSLEQIPESQAEARAMYQQAGDAVDGWYDPKTGDIYMNANAYDDIQRFEEKVFHEVVSHKGLEQLLGTTNYNALCDAVWDSMDAATRKKYMDYAKANNIAKNAKGYQRIAAKEYIAFLSESFAQLELNDQSEEANTIRSEWVKICDFLRELFKKVFGNVQITNEDLAKLVHASFVNMQRQAQGITEEQAPIDNRETTETPASNEPAAPVKRETKEPEEHTAAEFLNEALTETAKGNVPANVTIDETTIRDEEDSVEMDARLLIDGKPSNLSVTIFDQSLGSRGGYDPANLVKYYPFDNADNWSWEKADVLVNFFNNGEHSGKASVLDESDAVYFTSLQAAMEFAEFVNSEAANSPEVRLALAEAETDPNPTEAQKKAENYKQGHVTLWGLPITIENPKGSIRRGTDANGKKWEQEMHHTYGKIRRTEGVDGDHIDVFIGPNLTSDKVFVVDQRNVDTGEFDEHKCMLGFDSLEDAQNGYLSNYEEGWQGMGTVTEVTMDEFKKWIDSSTRKTKPFAEYKSVKPEGAASTAMEQTEEEPEIPAEEVKAMLDKLRALVENEEDQQAPQDYLHSLTDNEISALESEANDQWNAMRREQGLSGLNDPQIREKSPEGWKMLLLRNRVGSEGSRRWDMDMTEQSIANRKEHTESDELRRYYEYEFDYMRASARRDPNVVDYVNKAQEYLAKLSYDELAKIYNEVVRLQSEHDVPWILTKAYRDRTANMSNAGVFDYGLKQQGEIPEGKANKPKINANDWTANDELRPVMNGVYHDVTGVGVATNAHILLATPALYNPEHEGKIILKNGSTVDGKFPNWQGVFDQARRVCVKEATVDWDAIRNFIAGVKAKMKAEGTPLKKDSLANIIIRMPDGQVVIYRMNMFIPFADAAASVGANTLHYSPINGQTYAENNGSQLIIMPVDPESFKKAMDWGDVDNFYYDLQTPSEGGAAETPAEAPKAAKPKPTRKKAAPAQQAQAPAETDAEVIETQKPKNTDKIEDVGEKIGGARKDIVQETVDRINVNGDSFAKIFPKFDYHKLIANGLEPRLAAGLKYVCEHAKKSYKIRKKRFGEKNALEATRFMANYAKGYLLGDTSLDFTSEGWVFTAYGKRRYEFGIKLWESLREAMGDTMFDVDLSGYDCDIIPTEEERRAEAVEAGRKFTHSTNVYYRRNADGESVEFTPRYAINTPKGDKLFTAEEYDQAVQYFQDQVTSAINYQAANPFELAIYRKRGSDDCCVHAKIGGKWVELTPWGKEYGLKYRDEHRAELQAMAQRKAEELKEQRKNTRPEAKVEVKWFSGVEDVGSYRIATKIGKEYVPISEPMPVKDIWKYAREHHDELQAKAQELLNAYLDEQEANRGWKPQLNIGGLRNRVGTDWRNGADVTAERFRTEFGFRGVEFGNYVTQKERQRLLNECFDALHDMAEILGVSPRALSLNGQLGFAIGARGGAGAKAHYEPGKNVINLTKKNGWGALAHEWWHAMDYYFGKREKERPATGGVFREDVRKEMQDAFAAVMKAINGSEYLKRSQALDAKTNKRYYAEDTELGARAFEDYIAKQLIERGQVNDFLSHHTSEEDWNGDISNYPYPIEKDGTALADAFQKFFDTVEEQEDASTGNSVLFSVTDKKYAQFALTQANNPMLDDVHTGIRSVEDIHTLEETLNDDKLLVTEPDWEEEDIRRAIEDNQVTIYSSKPIQDGTFVTPSRMVAEDYAGGEIVYEKTVSPDKVAWIASDEGQYADTDHYDGNILFSISNQNNDIFYSNAERAVDGIKQDKATPEQWRAMIEKAGGLKAGEDKWIGLSEWLKAQVPQVKVEQNEDESLIDYAKRVQAERQRATVTKKDILDYIRDHKIQIEETEYGEASPETSPRFRAFQDEVTEMWENVNRMQNGRFNEANQDIIRFEDDMQAKYGDDWRDLMDDSERNVANYLQERRDEINMEVFLPEEVVMEEMCNRHGDDFQLAFSIDDDGSLSIANEDAAGYYLDVNPINDTRLQYTTEGLTNKHEIAMTVPTIEAWNEDDEIHFGDAGEGKVIAWARFGDATDEQGNKTLVIDEIQSKRHQEGREKGYRKDPWTLRQAKENLRNYIQHLKDKYRIDQVENLRHNILPSEGAEWKRLQDIYFEEAEYTGASRDDRPYAAPFEKNWHELAMKRILRFAAENGYDKVAWTTGDQQAARYNIGEVIDSITRNEDEDYPYSYSVISKDHGELEYDFDENGIYHDDGDPELDGKSMSDVFGKELAKRLQEMPAGETIDNEGLRIGGEGMRGFYDDILPRFMQKYGKKWGVQVGEVTMPQLEDGYQTMHAIDINDAMRESVMEGQPMFSITPKNTSLDQVLFSIKVNHNSPFLLKKADGAFVDPATGERLGFDHRFMSAGEGGQAHGWGSYFSVNDLRNYASSQREFASYQGWKAYQLPLTIENIPAHMILQISEVHKGRGFEHISKIAKDLLNDYRADIAEEQGTVRGARILDQMYNHDFISYDDEVDLLTKYSEGGVEWIKSFFDDIEKGIDALKEDDFLLPARHHYDVEIPDNTGENYIEEEQPLSKEQIERLRKANEELAQEDIFGHEYTRKYGRLYPFSDIKNFLLYAEMYPEKYPFRSFYSDVESFLGAHMNPEYITKLLQRAGFDGIHYEGQRDGECYVIFNENDAVITNHVLFSYTPKGDRIEKLRNSDPVVITGNEVEPSDDLKQYRKNARQYAKNLRGAYRNEDTGAVIELTASNKNGGIKEILQHDYKDIPHLQSVAAIPEIIKKSIYIDTLPNEDTKVDADAFDYYVCGLKIGNEDFTVKSVIVTLPDGTRYYDHKLTAIEKGKLIDLINKTPDPESNSISSESPSEPDAKIFGKDKRLFSILQINPQKNAKNLQNSSENADLESKSGENGEQTPKNTSLDQVLFSITVNHNSPYLLKKADGSFVDPETGERLGFDHRFMGRGEGGQAHGWGSYFSANDIRSYGEGYGFSLRDIKDIFNTSRWQSFGVGDAFDVAKNYLLEAHSEHARSLRKWLEDRLAQKQELLKSYEGKVANSAEEDLMVFRAEADVQYIPALLRDMVKDIDTRNRHHYDVEIPQNNGTNYIEEDAVPTNEQVEMICSAIRTEQGKEKVRNLCKDGINGRDLYRWLRDERFGSAEQTSLSLSEAGFVGIHYDGRRDGECYVIFNENDAKIVDHVMFSITEKDPVKRWEAENPKPKAKEDEPTIDYAKRLQQWNNEHRKVKDAIKDAQPLYDHAEYDGVLFSTTPPFTGETIGDLYASAKQRSDLNRKRRESAAITDMLIQLSKDNYWRMQEALHKINADIRSLRKAARMQVELDKTQLEAMLDLTNKLIQVQWAGGSDNPAYQPQTVAAIMQQIRNSLGKADISEEVGKIEDYLVHAQRTAAKRQWDKLRHTPIEKLTISGVVGQGKVALQGQHALKALNEALESHMTEEQLEEQVSNLYQKIDEATDESLRIQFTGRMIGYETARQHLERVAHLEQERQQLRDELIACRSNKSISATARKEMEASIKEAMRENNLAQAEAYTQSIRDLSEYVSEQVVAAKDFIEKQNRRREMIRGYAAKDLEGAPANPHRDNQKQGGWRKVWDAFSSPIRDLQSLLRMTGIHTPDGEGYLYNHFMRGWTDAADKERQGIVAAQKTMDDKIKELTHGKYKTWEQAARDIKSKSHKKLSVSLWTGEFDGTQPVYEEVPIDAGNALYIYAVNKMTDGKMKLTGMNITEQKVRELAEQVKEMFGQELLDVVDWVQTEFFSQLRNRYNPTHEALFGAPMDAIEDYFPLRILADARQKNEDLSEPDDDASRLLYGTSTGAIKRRTSNSLPLDVRHADFFQEVVRHVAQMERWNAFAQWTRDANILFSDIDFRNRIKNMNTVYGTGDKLYTYMKQAFQTAIGTYKPKTDTFSEITLNMAKGVTSAKINFRFWTALKQLASFPAFFTYMTDSGFMQSYMRNVFTPHSTLKWAKENLPGFEKRISKRDLGDMRLMQRSTDWELTKRALEFSQKYGMWANVLFDTLTCATGARAVYDARLAGYLKKGYSQEEAANRARQDAEQAFNTSQQSSEGAYMAPIQMDRNVITAALTVFRTSPIQYTRNCFYHARNILNKRKKGTKADMIDFRRRQYIADGLTEEQATKAATGDYNKSIARDIIGFTVYGALLGILWRLVGQVPYLMAGDDDDEKKKKLDEALSKGVFIQPVTGLVGGGVVESALDGYGKISDIFSPELPFGQDISKVEAAIGSEKYAAAASQALGVLMQMGTGFDPQTAADMVLRVVTTLDNDVKRDAAQKAWQVSGALLSIPNAQYEQIMLDDLVKAAKGTNLKSSINRYNFQKVYDRYLDEYTTYRKVHAAPLTWYIAGDEEAAKTEKAAETRFRKLLRERGIDKDVLPDTKASRDKKKRK